MPLSPTERTQRARIAAHTSWERTEDRAARLASARRAFIESFEDRVDPERKLPPAERARRAESARKAYYAQLAFKSAKARRLKREAREAAADRLAS